MTANMHPALSLAQAIFMQTPAPIAPPQQRVSTSDLCTAIRRWTRSNPSHQDLATVLFEMAANVAKNGALSDKCRKSVVDQLRETAGDVDQDFVNQRAEA